MSSSSGQKGFKPDKAQLLDTYRRLLNRYGPQHWWPGDSPFEIMVGAVLTQNTAWINVERAIRNLVSRQLMDPRRILTCDAGRLAEMVKPSGYFNVKVRRLKAFCRFFLEAGGVERLRLRETNELRSALRAVHGIGPETADDILLYGLERPVFVIDAYTRRLFERLGLMSGEQSYEELRDGFERALGPDTPLFNEYHALIVRHVKDVCKVEPVCSECCLAERCPSRR